MTEVTTISHGPQTDANGKSLLGGTMTIVTKDNGDGNHSRPVTYVNGSGVTVIDTRGTNYGVTPYTLNQPTVTNTVQAVDKNSAVIRTGQDNSNNLHVNNQMVTTIDTTNPVKPTEQVAAPDTAVLVEKGNSLGSL